jgi:hypothetical protein
MYIKEFEELGQEMKNLGVQTTLLPSVLNGR